MTSYCVWHVTWQPRADGHLHNQTGRGNLLEYTELVNIRSTVQSNNTYALKQRIGLLLITHTTGAVNAAYYSGSMHQEPCKGPATKVNVARGEGAELDAIMVCAYRV